MKINSLNEVSRGMPLEVSNICRFNPKDACDEIIWFAGGPQYARQMPKHQDRCTIPRSRAIRMASVRPPAPSFLSI